jgi:surfeit locus 1 family protein
MTARGWQVLIASVLGCAILIGLGVWQLQRLETKQALLQQIEKRQTLAPVSLEQALAAAEATGDIDYLPIKTKGRFESQTAFLMLTTFDGSVAWRVIAPFRSNDDVLVLVDRGVIPDGRRANLEVATPSPDREVELSGYALWHRSSPGLFVPENDATANIWHWWDVPAMLAGLQLGEALKVAPFVLHLAPTEDSLAFPRPVPADAPLRNYHLQYALTWFALAVVLAIFAGLFIKTELKQPGRQN